MSLTMRVNRILQHANIGLDAQDDDDNSLLFPYVMSIVICLIGVLYFLQCCYMYVCRVYCGREPVRSGEEILSELTEDQRKAVMKSILAKLCKAATDSDISQQKLKRDAGDVESPISELEIPAILEPETRPFAESPTEEEEDPSTVGIDLSAEEKDVAINVPLGTNNQQSEDSGDVSLREGDDDAEENVDVSVAVDSVDSGDMSTSNTPTQTEVVHDTMSGDIEEGADTIVDTVEEEEDPGLDSLQSCDCPSENPPATGSLVARRSTICSTASSDNSSLGHVCPICLGGYQKGDMLFVSTRCDHLFHADCIGEWMEGHEGCPVCRVKMVTDEEMATAAMALIDSSARNRFFY